MDIRETGFDAGVGVNVDLPTFGQQACVVSSVTASGTQVICQVPAIAIPLGSPPIPADVELSNPDGQTTTVLGTDPIGITFEETVEFFFANNPFDWGTTATNETRTFTIENRGSLTSGVLSINIIGPGSLLWTINSDGCSGIVLNTGDTCDIDITFTPVFMIYPSGPYQATIEVTDGTNFVMSDIEGIKP